MSKNQEYLAKGIKYFEEDNYAKAIEYFTQSLKVSNEKFAETYAWRARAYLRFDKPELALKDFDKAIEIQPHNATLYTDRGVVKHVLGKNNLALLDLDYAVSIDSGYSYRYASRAFLKDRMGDLEGAINDYGKALELDPEDSISHNNLGLLLEKKGYKRTAQNYYSKADELAAKDGFMNMPLTDEKNKTTQQKAMLQPLESEEKFNDLGYIGILKKVFTDRKWFQDYINFITNKKA